MSPTSRNPIATLKLLSSKTRFAILKLLTSSHSTLCVHEIAGEINLSHSATCHQLSKLEKEGIVSSKRDGQTVCYNLKQTPEVKNIQSIIKLFAEKSP